MSMSFPLKLRTGTSIRKEHHPNLTRDYVLEYFEQVFKEQYHDEFLKTGAHEFELTNTSFRFLKLRRYNRLASFNRAKITVTENKSYININFEGELKRMLIQMLIVLGIFLLWSIALGFFLSSLPSFMVFWALLFLLRWVFTRMSFKIFLDRKKSELETWR